MEKLAMDVAAGPQFQLSEEQDMLVRMARDFVTDNVIPVAAQYDEESRFPGEIFHKARELGIVNMLVPEAYGGVGATAFEEALVSEELGYGCTGISTSLGVNSLACLPILIAGNEAQKAYWLGERVIDKGEFVSYAVTEANAGSNVAGIQTRAEKRGRQPPDQRQQDFHHQRQPCSFLHHLRQDGSGSRASRHDLFRRRWRFTGPEHRQEVR